MPDPFQLKNFHRKLITQKLHKSPPSTLRSLIPQHAHTPDPEYDSRLHPQSWFYNITSLRRTRRRVLRSQFDNNNADDTRQL